MTAQPSFFSVEPEYAGRYRRTNPRTSVDAAKVQSGRTERLILEVFRPGVEITADQIVAVVRASHPELEADTIKTAISRCGLVAAGEGKSNRGRRMTKWRLP